MMDENQRSSFSGIMGEIIYEGHSECEIKVPGPFHLIIFGASGDLTKRKIIPSAYRLYKNRLLPDQFCILGTARTEMDDNAFREMMKNSVKKAFPEDFSQNEWERFGQRLFYLNVAYEGVDSYAALKEKSFELEKKFSPHGNRIFYLAIPPALYESVIENLGVSGLSLNEKEFSSIVIEKPFGSDLDSARKLNGTLKQSFRERQIFRMDHYLMKETVQNILMFRFANSIFEPLWNRKYIDHVQITVSETLGVEHRAGYYEKAGVLRDMFQNHIFQLLALTAMEPPSVFEADRVRDEKVKVFRSVRHFPLERLNEFVVVGQYGAGMIGDEGVVGYREEPGIAAESTTPTYAALKVFIDNWRWNGVPFYMRSGKRLAKRKAEISIHFKEVPHLMFSKHLHPIDPNVLVLRIQPDEGVSLIFQAKVPGSKLCLNPVIMRFSYQQIFPLSAYERVLLDCIEGDQMLFVREDGVDETWKLLTPVIEKVEEGARYNGPPNYMSGSSGPEEADLLIQRDNRIWREI